MNKYMTILTAVILPVILCGCGEGFYGEGEKTAGSYYVNPEKGPTSIRQAAIFEFENLSNHPNISSDVTKELYTRLQKNAPFGTYMINQNDRRWNSCMLDPYGSYTAEQLNSIEKTLDCEAVLIGTITEYQPYPHMTIGIRLKLVDLRDGELLWAYENSWDCTDKNTQDQMVRYFKNHTRYGNSDIQQELITISPLNFFKFVAHEASGTITADKKS